jgi:SAM-dependent methyltransferase
MPERTAGLYKATQNPRFFAALHSAVGADRARRFLVREYIRPRRGDNVIDLGCGSGAMLPYLGEVNYIGIDHNPAHIAQARRLHGNRGCFHCGDWAVAAKEGCGAYDLVLCFSLLHHLDDMQVARLCDLARDKLLARGGRFVAVDIAFVPGQNLIARMLAALDAGQYVRTPEAYKALVGERLADARTIVHHNLLRLPYTHCITMASSH